MEKTIRFYCKNVWGNATLYPVDYAEAIEILTTQKTLTARTMKGLKLLGYEFVEVMESQARQGKVSPESNFEQARRDI